MNRKNTKTFKEIIGNFKFRLMNITILNQAMILLCLTGIASLFFPWVIDKENFISWNSFSSISGNIGYIMIVIYVLLLFLVIFSNEKEKIKLYVDLNFKNHFIVISSGIASICFGIIMISFVNGLSAVGQNIVHGNGLILSMAVGTFIFILGIFMRKDYKKMNSEIILEHLNQNREKVKEKNNMSLPI